jgi:hypothetical protein
LHIMQFLVNYYFFGFFFAATIAAESPEQYKQYLLFLLRGLIAYSVLAAQNDLNKMYYLI